MSGVITPDQCPDCADPLTPVAGFPAWCAACGWGVIEAPASPTPRPGLLRARLDQRSARMVESLYEEVAGSSAHRPGWDAARVASYGVALCVHALAVALAATAVCLIVLIPNIVTVVLAIVAALIAWAIRPRFGSLRKTPDVRRRADAPALFGLLDRVASDLGARPIDAVVPSEAYNAGYAALGLRRRRVLVLGLPLWEAMPPEQKVALLGHELAHGVNGDARHGVIVGTSLSTLGRLHGLLRPGPRDHRQNYFIDLAVRTIQRVASGLVAAVFVLQRALTLRAGQRAEYLADDLAARIASPAATADMLGTLLVAEDTHATTVQQHMLNDRKTDYWDAYRDALAAVPESERERRRRTAAHRALRVDESHPPTHLRIAVLRGRPAAEPAVVMEPGEEERIRAELAAEYGTIARRLRDDARERLYRH
ncbi:M48 family metalloprotease [Actinomadura nitritigenes]|uniref:M48 family metalloprotease n=1 Tax=Actinomadura nitritigenes TaxID=134602 RepID=UPI003D8B257C